MSASAHILATEIIKKTFTAEAQRTQRFVFSNRERPDWRKQKLKSYIYRYLLVNMHCFSLRSLRLCGDYLYVNRVTMCLALNFVLIRLVRIRL